MSELNKNFRNSSELEHTLLQAILDYSPACIIIAEAPSGEIIYINRAVKQFRGLTDAQMKGIKIEEYVLTWKEFSAEGKELSGEEMPLGRAIINNEIIINEEIIVELDNGEKKWALATAAPVKNVEGKTIAGIVLWMDITKNKNSENEKEELINSLKDALNNVKLLKGLLPICSNCKKIRDDKGYWNRMETYIEKHTEASFSHSLCLDCAKKIYGDEAWFKDFENEK